jgi:hypothetical protein
MVRGETEILPGVRLLPTAGHVAGHQSLVLSCQEGPVVLAGQAHDDASGYARADFACSLARSRSPGPVADTRPGSGACRSWSLTRSCLPMTSPSGWVKGLRRGCRFHRPKCIW